MKILFHTSNKDLSLGSYRIWSNNLNKYFNNVNVNSTEDSDTIDSCDVIILSKNDSNLVSPLKRTYPNKLIGTINTAADAPKVDCDFVIVGSLEEKASLSNYENVFYFPLIEDKFQPPELYKTHEQKENLTIGFHGSFSHISKLGFQSRAILMALKEFSQEQNITLKIITTPGVMLPSMPNFPTFKTEIKDWNYGTVGHELLECDIGIVPNIAYLSLNDLVSRDINSNKGFFESDYLLRLKNKSNAGRSFVFHQLGIPVISDLTPSNLHVMGSGECGHIVSNQLGWLRSFRDLKDYKKRQLIADRAKQEFDRLYDPDKWAKKLYNEIKGIKK